MLYRLSKEDNTIELMPYADFESLAKKEKDLENLLAENLGDLYIEDGQLMRIFQERARQEEPDLCALDKNGNFRAPIASLSTRNWIESKIISLINKEVIDVNTPGGSAIQMASFGFKGKDVDSYSNIHLLNQNIDNLDLSIKLNKILKARGINTIKDLSLIHI